MRNIFSLQPVLDDPNAYPLSEWFEQAARYWQYFFHFDGDLFDEQVGGSEAYPLKLNIYNIAAMIHAGFLFGEVRDTADPLVKTIIEPWGMNSTAEEYDLGRRLSEIVNMAWYENDGRDLQQENGIISQVAGGCVFDTAYDPERVKSGDADLAIRIGQTMPYYFFPVWGQSDHRRLIEAIVTFHITALQAKAEYGVDPEEPVTDVQYQEHWKRDEYTITAGGQPITFEGVVQGSEPLGGFVPYTYIPHIRTGEFYGESLFKGKDNMAKEVNARWADLGDIVADNARSMPFIWNSQHPTIRRLSRTYPVVDLGQEIPGMGSAPGVASPSSSSADSGSVQHASNLLSLARAQAFTPDVVYGIDEGSQRSYLTLAVRMIPLIVHIRQERTHWTTGLNRVARQILKICAEKGIEGVKPEQLRRLKIYQDWSPMLPRDRESELNEIILRLNSDLIPLETALERLGDIQDVKTAMNLIKKWKEYKASVEATGMQAGPFGGAGADGEQAGLNRPTEPQASIKEE